MTSMRKLGADGPDVFPIGYGAMSFTDFYGPTSEADSHAILDLAQEIGMNHIDTSNVYGAGRSEATIGSYFARNPAARNFFVVATKAGIATNPDTGARYYDNSAAYLEAELDKSLTRLGLETVDLFYVHRRDADTPIEEVTDSLAALVAKGKTRSIGYSEIAPSSLRRAHAVHPVAAVQSEFSLGTRSPELGLVQSCAELGVALVAFSSNGRGLLTDTPPSAEKVAGIPFLKGNPRFMHPNLAFNLEATAAFRRLAADMGISASGLAHAWLLAQGDHVIPIPGTRAPNHLREAVEAVSHPLSADDLARIEAALPVGWCHGDRYNAAQWNGPERYC